MYVEEVKKAIDALDFALKTWSDVNVIDETQRSLKFENDSLNLFMSSMNSFKDSMNSLINSMNSLMNSLNHVVR